RVQCDGNAAVIVELETGFEALFEQLPRRDVIALLTRQNCGSERQAGTQFWTRRGSFQREHSGHRVPPLREMFPRFPEAKQSGAETEAPLGIPSTDQIVECRPEVVVLNLKSVEPFGVSDHVLGAFLGKHQVVSSMGAACRR